MYRGYGSLLGESGRDVWWARAGVRRSGWLVRLIVSSFPGCPDGYAFFEKLDERGWLE